MPYITGAEYIAKYGRIETTRLTDEQKTGEYNSAKLDEALADGASYIDGFVGSRYGLPLTSTPPLLKNINGVLAREILHKTNPTDEVKRQADIARSNLLQISNGKIALPVDTGDAPVSTGGMSYTSGDGVDPTFSNDSLRDYTSISAPYPGGCWRR